MVALSPQTVMFGNPPTSGHQPSRSDLSAWMTEIESLAAGGGLSYVNSSLAALNQRPDVSAGQFALVLNTLDEAGVYEHAGGVWTKVAEVPAVFLESQAATQVLAARDEVVAAALAVALDASTAQAAAEASGLAAFFDTKAGADAGLAGLAEDELIEVLADETQGGRRVRYRVVGGALVLKLVIGDMRADRNLAELADKDAALGILGLTSKGKELVKAATAAAMRTVLELKAGALAALATEAQAQAGTDNTAYMTALRTKQAVAAQVPELIPASGVEASVNFNGTGTVAIRGSGGNIAGITDNGVGAYTVNFAVDLPDANYSPLVVAGLANGSRAAPQVRNLTVSGFDIYVNNHGNGYGVDAEWVSAVVITH